MRNKSVLLVITIVLAISVGLPLVSEVIKLLITIVGQISKFKSKYARGVRHSAVALKNSQAERFQREQLVAELDLLIESYQLGRKNKVVQYMDFHRDPDFALSVRESSNSPSEAVFVLDEKGRAISNSQ